MGDGSRDDEKSANSEVDFLIRFTHAILKGGGWITIENLRRLLIWKHLKKLIDASILKLVHLDQCYFGLRSPNKTGKKEIWKKATTFACSCEGFENLGKLCPGNHQHVQIQGLAP